MTPVVLACGDAPLPLPLASVSTTSAPAGPESDLVDEALSKLQVVEDPRLIVVGDDADLAAVLTRMLRTDRLHVELAYVTEHPTAATAAYRLATGAKAAQDALGGSAHALPLIRDDAGIALVGEATYVGEPNARLVGEMYVDDDLLFSGETTKIRVHPTPEMPGLRAATDRSRRWLPRKWIPGRAAQLGSTAANLVRDGVPHPRPLTRSTFYRDQREFLLVR
ncbi:hypothetical protein DW322_20505 [Rhodococcus rhodnii]|uniref:Peptidase M50 n=1 Tax=Rhodococcus rhodnii TaxID=38312 RepID=A0A6P2CH79_9NOCA|nr:hypothetical protein [Rhodococcus rhodnii]TXG92117.1 hypothetical protein DW322_20505 [Rhodococcus rhodnii]